MVFAIHGCVHLCMHQVNLKKRQPKSSPHSDIELTFTECHRYQKYKSEKLGGEKLCQMIFHTKMQIQLLTQKFQKSHIAESWKDVHWVMVTLNACYFL